MSRTAELSLAVKEICRYGACTPDSRNFQEGEKVINAGHILVIGKRPSSNPAVYQIYALVLKTSALYDEPHKIEGSIEKKSLQIQSFTCSCKAGSDKCKHILAVLMHCNRNSMSKLEEVSNTDIKCLWSQKKNVPEELYKATSVYGFCCTKPRKTLELNLNPQEYEDLLDEMRNVFIEAAPLSALARHKKMTETECLAGQCSIEQLESPISKEELDFAKNICLNNDLLNFVAEADVVGDLKDCCRKLYAEKILVDLSEVMEIFIITSKDKERWKMERQYRISGSRCYNIYTAANNPKTNWVDKSKKYFWPKNLSNDAIKHGIDTEPLARKAYEEYYGVSVKETGLIVSQSNCWASYSPDGIILDEKNKAKKLLEIKCPLLGKELHIEDVLPTLPYLQKIGDYYYLRKKHPYYGQISLGMALLGIDECDFMIFCPENKETEKEATFQVEPIKLDLAFTTKLLLTLKRTYFEKMLHNLCDFFSKEDEDEVTLTNS